MLKLSDYEILALKKLGEAIHQGKWSNEGLVQLIELSGDYLNALTIQEYADAHGISYQAARKRKQTEILRQKRIIDND
jgi:hypothetical protein